MVKIETFGSDIWPYSNLPLNDESPLKTGGQKSPKMNLGIWGAIDLIEINRFSIEINVFQLKINRFN